MRKPAMFLALLAACSSGSDNRPKITQLEVEVSAACKAAKYNAMDLVEKVLDANPEEGWARTLEMAKWLRLCGPIGLATQQGIELAFIPGLAGQRGAPPNIDELKRVLRVFYADEERVRSAYREQKDRAGASTTP